MSLYVVSMILGIIIATISAFIIYTQAYERGKHWNNYKKAIPRFNGFYDVKYEDPYILSPQIKKNCLWDSGTGKFIGVRHEIIEWSD